MTIRYFIPDWDDRVDPGYNFETDTHTDQRHPYHDDRYAHELYETPPYDGILLSRAVVDANSTKRTTIQEIGSVHRYLRLPEDGTHQVMGDCGAFSYRDADVPPYDTQDVLDYYTDLGFDIGVSVDHLVFAEFDQATRERRWSITIENAREFLHAHHAGDYRFLPMGVAQGWDEESYLQAVQALVEMGYTAIAIGGLVRSTDKEILRVLEAIQPALQPGMQIHLFGVSRPEQVATFQRLGVTSFDSASRLRKAWTDSHKNYFLNNTAYMALRIRDAQRVAKDQGLNEGEIREPEQHALKMLRAYDTGMAPLDETLAAVLAYAQRSGRYTERMKTEYERTLRDMPWKQCECAICQEVGIEVMIFRGNNRNRRRGFHNTWQLYRQLQQVRDDSPMAEEPPIEQLQMC